jgi:hypothetical protein
VRRETVFKATAHVSKDVIVVMPPGSERCHVDVRAVLIKDSADSTKYVRGEVKSREFRVQRIAKNQITGHGLSENIAWNFIVEISLKRDSEVLEREVLAINAASPSVLANGAMIIIKSHPVRAENAQTEFVTAKVTYSRCRWWRYDFPKNGV